MFTRRSLERLGQHLKGQRAFAIFDTVEITGGKRENCLFHGH